jgi:ubiquinone biosynthesis protein COQ4
MNSVISTSDSQPAPRYGHETPLAGSFRPWIAFDAIGKLIRDKEDTTQVFRILQSLRGRSFDNMVERFRKTEVGARVFAHKEDLIEVASDLTYLRGLPEDSFGRAYLNFMENCGITPQGLLEAEQDAGIVNAERLEDYRRFNHRTTVAHDMWHVVSGYGCEGLGEVCVVALSYPQTRNLGFSVIALAGGHNYAKHYPTDPVWKAVRQAYARGKRAAWLPGVDWAALLPRSLAQVRAELGLADTPDHYIAAEKCRAESLHASPVPKAT